VTHGKSIQLIARIAQSPSRWVKNEPGMLPSPKIQDDGSMAAPKLNLWLDLRRRRRARHFYLEITREIVDFRSVGSAI
jgi:hypothetical protein